MYIALGRSSDGVVVTRLADDGQTVIRIETIPSEDLPALIRAHEMDHPRWVWDDTGVWYPNLLNSGVEIERCVDLRLCHRILRDSILSAHSTVALRPDGWWDRPVEVRAAAKKSAETLFDLEHVASKPAAEGEDDPVIEFREQQVAVEGSSHPGKLRLLLAGESAGALIAAEIRHAGLPWSVDVHDGILTQHLGPRPRPGVRPARMTEVLLEIRSALNSPDLNPDSQPHLLRALRQAGLDVDTTSQWVLQELDHPVIAPLRNYRKMSRLLTANGWNWLDEWVHGGRFHPEYVVGGVVTGRWATSGGGALQLPHEVRSAVIADPEWKLVVADAAQLEPRVLAGLSSDVDMAQAGRGGDMYQGIVETGALPSRDHAKIAMLGALYGGTTGGSGQLMPRLRKTFPRAIAYVEQAAQAGERGESVMTRLGRTSPLPDDEWREMQRTAYGEHGNEKLQFQARTQARTWGRFTRNFVVQGSAAEWALCWMASVRRRLRAIDPSEFTNGEFENSAVPMPFVGRPHLVFFLHDEIIVHSPASLADRVADEVKAAAQEAGQLLFADFPVDFPLSTAIVDNYAEAK